MRYRFTKLNKMLWLFDSHWCYHLFHSLICIFMENDYEHGNKDYIG